jgi:hypothetical protein
MMARRKAHAKFRRKVIAILGFPAEGASRADRYPSSTSELLAAAKEQRAAKKLNKSSFTPSNVAERSEGETK